MMTSLRTKSDKAIFMARLSGDNIFIPTKFFVEQLSPVSCPTQYTHSAPFPVSSCSFLSIVDQSDSSKKTSLRQTSFFVVLKRHQNFQNVPDTKMGDTKAWND